MMLKHTLLAWLFTCIAGTMILGGYFAFEEGGFKGSDMEAFVLIALAITLIVSIPAMIIYGILMSGMSGRMALHQLKLIGSGYAVLATAFTFAIVAGILSSGWLEAESAAMLLLALPYALCFALAVWIIPMPEALVAAPSEGEYLTRGFPSNPPTAYYIVATISVALLLYGVSMIFRSGLLQTRGTAWIGTVMQFLDLGIAAAALAMFLRWKSIGWKLVTGLSAAGLTGMLLSIGTAVTMISEHGAQLWRYYVPVMIFGVLDGLALYLLARPELRLRYGAIMRDFGIWILAGAGYALLRMGIYRVVYGG